MFKKYIHAAWLGVKSARLRTVIAVLGISMGIFLVISLLAVGRGVDTQIKEQVATIGSDVISISSTSSDQDQGPNIGGVITSGISVPTLTSDDLSTISREPSVSAATPLRYLGGDVNFGNRKTTPTFLASTDYKYPFVRDIKMLQGRFFTKKEQSDTTPKVVIGTATKVALFGEEDPLGKSISYNGRDLVVVGVADKIGSTSDEIGANNLDNSVYGPPSLVENADQGVVYSMILAKIASVSSISTTKQSIETNLAKYRSSASFNVRTEADRINTSQTILDMISAFIAIIAVISLFISGVGIMNVMVVAVTDRTREIGVRKTVGATSRNIFVQFLIETLMLTLMGGLLGVGLAVTAVFVIQKISPVTPEISGDLVGLGLGLSVVVGLIFGVGPALGAANKEPIEALQTDRS